VIDCFAIFDAHVHVGRWRTPDFAGRATTLDESAALLAAAGVTGALVMPTDEADNAGTLAAVRAHAGSPALLFAAWVDPRDASLPAFLDAYAPEIHALKVHTSFTRLPLTDPAFAPFLDLAEARGWPVVVHCGRWREVAGFEHAIEVARERRGLKLLLSHMGGDSPALVLGAAEAVRDRHLANVHLGTESIREYWLVRRAVDLVGPERVVFGSDHNLNHPASFLAVIDALGLAPADRELVLGGNARRLLAR
jgi:predicted TIM-barrel fold metal-dependent hydrolase